MNTGTLLGARSRRHFACQTADVKDSWAGNEASSSQRSVCPSPLGRRHRSLSSRLDPVGVSFLSSSNQSPAYRSRLVPSEAAVCRRCLAWLYGWSLARPRWRSRLRQFCCSAMPGPGVVRRRDNARDTDLANVGTVRGIGWGSWESVN
jgi:hypothetical protein